MWSRFGLLVVVGVVSSSAQTGQIAGQVVDQHGGTVSGATVKVTEIGTAQSRTVTTDERGLYSIPLLKPSDYVLTVEKPGFQAVESSNRRIAVNEIARLDVTLRVAGIHGEITIDSGAHLLDSETPSVGHVVHGDQILGLPLLGRNTYALGMLAPGVRTALGMNNLVTDPGSTSAVSINGGRNNMNSFLLDGSPNTSALQNQPIIFPSADSTQEFKVDTNSFSAEYGRAAGGVFNVVTKSGSNQLHLTAYEFLRNDAVNANDWFANRERQPQPPLRLNQFGAAIGGPFDLPRLYAGRNRTFFFVSAELVRFAQGVTFTGTVPTASQLAGDFSQLLNSQGRPLLIYDPTTTRANPDGGFIRNPFPDNTIPPFRIDRVARSIGAYWPVPNASGALYTGATNFVRTDANRIDKNGYSARIDHKFAETTWSFLRFSHDATTNTVAAAYGTGAIASPVNGPQDIVRYNAAAELDHIFSPAFLALVRLSFARLSNIRPPFSGGFNMEQLGFTTDVARAGEVPSFPTIAVANYNVASNIPNVVTGGSLGSSNLLANISNDYTLSASATRALGNHTLKFGGEARRIELNVAANNSMVGFSFSQSYTQGPGVTNGNSGNALATFLLGVAAGGAATTPFLALAYRYQALFVEDRFKLRRNLTATVGLRYDLESPRTDRFNQLTNFDFEAAPPLDVPGLNGALAFVGVNGKPRFQSDYDRNNFAPRLGVSWNPSTRTAVRSGGGIFYAPTTGITGTASAFGISGFQASTTVNTSTDGLTPLTYLGNPFPQGLNRPTKSSLGGASSLGQDIAFYDRANVVPYSAHWTFNVQHDIGASLLLDVAYVGTRGLKFPSDRQLNQLPDTAMGLGDALTNKTANPFLGRIAVGALSADTVAAAQLLRPFPHFRQVTSTAAGWSSSRYHALQVKLEKRHSRGFGALLAYTYSKVMDDSSGNLVGGEALLNGTIQNWNNLRADWSTSALDQTHRVVLGFVCAPPWWKGERGVRGRLFGGWEAGAIASVFTGAPVSVISAVDNTFSQGGTPRPNWTGVNPKLAEPGPALWFDTSQFSSAPPYTFGNAPRSLNGTRTDGVRNVDVGLHKTTAIRGQWQLQIRGEAFNLLNRPQFGPPNPFQGAPAFGAIRSMENLPRILQLGLKLIY